MADSPEPASAGFTREHGCTETEWLRCLPGAVGGHALALPAPGQARIDVGDGRLELRWHALAPRRIALAQVPRLQVDYRFEGVDAAARQTFMRYFDLFMQRGGG